jgi:hypothetical protein
MIIERQTPSPADHSRSEIGRRRLLRGLAAVPAVAALAAATPPALTAAVPDPIFAAIEAHRAANAAHEAAIAEGARLEKLHGFMDEWSRITKKPCDDENEAFDILVGAPAATIAGLLSKIEYLLAIADEEAWMLDERAGTAQLLIESFVASLRNVGVLS